MQRECLSTDLCKNFVRAEVLLGELPGRAGSVEVLGLHICMVTDLEGWCRSKLGVSGVLVSLLHDSNLVLEFTVQLL